VNEELSLADYFAKIFKEKQPQAAQCSSQPVAAWREIIGDPIYADAVLDRPVHNADRLSLAGESMRRLKTDPTA
jgi:DNA replication protein DnaC